MSDNVTRTPQTGVLLFSGKIEFNTRQPYDVQMRFATVEQAKEYIPNAQLQSVKRWFRVIDLFVGDVVYETVN